MNKKKKLLIAILITILVIALIYIFLKKEKIIWTSENSLVLSKLKISEDEGDFDNLIKSVDQSLLYYSKIDQETIFDFGKQWCSAADMKICLEDFREKLNKYGLSDKFLKYI